MSYKVPIIVQDEYIVYCEPNKYGVIVHCDVLVSWTKEVKTKLQQQWKQLRELHSNKRMIAIHYPEQGIKHIKFLQMMGFRFHHDNDKFKVYIIGE